MQTLVPTQGEKRCLPPALLTGPRNLCKTSRVRFSKVTCVISSTSVTTEKEFVGKGNCPQGKMARKYTSVRVKKRPWQWTPALKMTQAPLQQPLHGPRFVRKRESSTITKYRALKYNLEKRWRQFFTGPAENTLRSQQKTMREGPLFGKRTRARAGVQQAGEAVLLNSKQKFIHRKFQGREGRQSGGGITWNRPRDGPLRRPLDGIITNDPGEELSLKRIQGDSDRRFSVVGETLRKSGGRGDA